MMTSTGRLVHPASTAGSMSIDEWRDKLSDKIVNCSAMSDCPSRDHGVERGIWCTNPYGTVQYAADHGDDTYYIGMDSRCCGEKPPWPQCWWFSKNGPSWVSSIPKGIADAAWDKLQKYIEKPRTKKLSIDIEGMGEVEYYPSYEDDYYPEGAEVALTAKPDNYWLFDQWKGDLSGTSKEKTLVMDTDKTVTAVFVPKKLAVLVSPEDGKEIPVVLPTTDMIQLVADADVPDVYNPRVRLYVRKNGEETWQFDSYPTSREQRMTWGIMIGSSGTAPGELYVEPGDTIEWWVEVANGAPYNNVLDLSKHRTFNVVQGKPTEYKLTVSVEGQGSVMIHPDTVDNMYREGEKVRLTALPANGYKFVEWKGDITGTEKEVYITMDSDKSVTATFTGEQPCEEGATKCKGYDLYKCQDGKWQLVEENSEQCGYTPRRDLRWLALLAPALLAGLPELTQGGEQL